MKHDWIIYVKESKYNSVELYKALQKDPSEVRDILVRLSAVFIDRCIQTWVISPDTNKRQLPIKNIARISLSPVGETTGYDGTILYENVKINFHADRLDYILEAK